VPCVSEALTSKAGGLRPAVRVLGVLVPGQLRAFPVVQLAAAREWLAPVDGAGA
jgi:hypothetical protein